MRSSPRGPLSEQFGLRRFLRWGGARMLVSHDAIPSLSRAAAGAERRLASFYDKALVGEPVE